MLSHIVTSFLAVAVALFPIVNPIGMVPVFIQLTEGSTDTVRAAVAMRIAVGGLCLMLGALFVGSYILAFFGLTIPAVQVAGGLLVISTGWRLMNQGDTDRQGSQVGKVPAEVILRRSFFPLTMPLTVGPGTISVAIVMGSKSASSDSILIDAIGAVAGVVLVAAAIYICFRYATRVIGFLGPEGSDVVTRLSAFILMCLGVQILWNGYTALAALGGH
ncbi:MAG TPA: MarC family protein [Magnetospirillaceae bacterium]|jgi:multiple antibiotic resistance protein